MGSQGVRQTEERPADGTGTETGMRLEAYKEVFPAFKQ